MLAIKAESVDDHSTSQHEWTGAHLQTSLDSIGSALPSETSRLFGKFNHVAQVDEFGGSLGLRTSLNHQNRRREEERMDGNPVSRP